MSEWQPISTAPKDGSRILVFGGKCTLVEIAYSDSAGVWCELYEDRRIASDPPDNPTHWMQLPQPPKEEA